MKNVVEWYVEDIERGIFVFPNAKIHYRMTREEIIQKIKTNVFKGTIKKLINNIFFEQEGYIICGDVAMKGKVFFLRNGKISQIILYHGMKNDVDEYSLEEKYRLSKQFLNALIQSEEKIYAWGSIRTFISMDALNGGEVYITLSHQPQDPFKS